MDFCAFPEIKAKLCGQRFDSTSDLTKAARTIVSTFSEDWYAEIYRKWISRHQKCVDLNGDYVEKVCVGRWTEGTFNVIVACGKCRLVPLVNCL